MVVVDVCEGLALSAGFVAPCTRGWSLRLGLDLFWAPAHMCVCVCFRMRNCKQFHEQACSHVAMARMCRVCVCACRYVCVCVYLVRS